MSKSYGNSIMLGATAQETAKLIKKSPTDSERRITFDPIGRPQVSALLTTAGLVTGRDPKEIAEEIGDSGAGALKAYVIESVNSFLEPHRARREELAKDMDYVRERARRRQQEGQRHRQRNLGASPRSHGHALLKLQKRHNHALNSVSAIKQRPDCVLCNRPLLRLSGMCHIMFD